MPEKAIIKMYDVVIIGAGPAGCTCALALQNSGLKIALIDKAKFPREKICGDLINGRAIKTLIELSESYFLDFKKSCKPLYLKNTKCYYKKNKIEIEWTNKAYLCKRVDFDFFLLGLVRKNTSADIYDELEINKINYLEDYIYAEGGEQKIVFKSRIIVGADGAKSLTAKILGKLTPDNKNSVSAVRAYFQNVTNVCENTSEIYFEKKYPAGYFWIFPISENIVNVGFGMLDEEITRSKINIKEALNYFIEQTKEISFRFNDSKQITNLKGAGLPLGSRMVNRSGQRFLLLGDAASLIDPMGGDGIGNAMFSGKIAAKQIKDCFINNNFSKDYIQNFDKKIYSSIGLELRKHSKALRYYRIPLVLDVVFWLGKINFVKRIIKKQL